MAGVFVVLNVAAFLLKLDCDACFFAFGLPFAFYHDDGSAGSAGVLWKGLAADLAIGIAVSAFAGAIWQAIAAKEEQTRK